MGQHSGFLLFCVRNFIWNWHTSPGVVLYEQKEMYCYTTPETNHDHRREPHWSKFWNRLKGPKGRKLEIQVFFICSVCTFLRSEGTNIMVLGLGWFLQRRRGAFTHISFVDDDNEEQEEESQEDKVLPSYQDAYKGHGLPMICHDASLDNCCESYVKCVSFGSCFQLHRYCI